MLEADLIVIWGLVGEDEALDFNTDDFIKPFPSYEKEKPVDAHNSKLIGLISLSVVFGEMLILVLLDIAGIRFQIKKHMIPNIKYGIRNCTKKKRRNSVIPQKSFKAKIK
ncbi:DgyrCDS13936 [Dimorphilus gyrociliatus]|uniref:DgyrCDS13936 n=1 Tax=Dimorphilus gyrociliatus TaxID=2664684 RepID=A0A7I8WC27_9ANNE|nr:DgyrCDS13936 [Dimorphilus gyrociliatus]